MESMDGLKRRIAAGEYTVDSREVAGAIVDKLALIKRARREMEAADENAGNEAARTSRRRGPRGATPANRPSGRRAERPSEINGE
jgi:hypothetical protein